MYLHWNGGCLKKHLVLKLSQTKCGRLQKPNKKSIYLSPWPRTPSLAKAAYNLISLSRGAPEARWQWQPARKRSFGKIYCQPPHPRPHLLSKIRTFSNFDGCYVGCSPSIRFHSWIAIPLISYRQHSKLRSSFPIITSGAEPSILIIASYLTDFYLAVLSNRVTN